MNTTNDNWCRIECGHCKWFRADADIKESTCKRLDHKHFRFAKKIFKCYDCGQRQGNICADFEPSNRAVWLKSHWKQVKLQLIPYKDTDVIHLNIDGNADVRYAIKAQDFYNNTFINSDGTLKWIYKCYVVKSRKAVTGYKTVYEYSGEQNERH